MDHLNRLVSIFPANQNRNLDLAGGDHINVNICVVESFKKLCRHAGAVDHACAHHRNLCYL